MIVVNEEVENQTERDNPSIKLAEMHRSLNNTQSIFALKLMSKHLLPQAVVDDIIEYRWSTCRPTFYCWLLDH